MAPYIISGLVAGSITAISALGLLLTYKSSRVFNFAHGAIAYSIAIFYYYLTHRNGWSIEIAAPFTILDRRAAARAAPLLRAVPTPHPRDPDRAARLDGRPLGRAPRA